jgi:hypothetical protein
MQASVSPAGVFPCQAQHQHANGTHSRGPARAFRPGQVRVAAGEEVAVPAQHRVRAHQKPHAAQHVARQPVQQRSQERPITRVEPHLLGAQLPFQHSELVAQRQDLHILVPIAHRQQTQEGERVRHTKVRQSQQHGRPSCCGDYQVREHPRGKTWSRVGHPVHRSSSGRMRFSAGAALVPALRAFLP